MFDDVDRSMRFWGAFGRSIATSECHGESLESLRNRLLFSPSAPPSFLRNLVRKLGTPRHSATCAQVRVMARVTERERMVR